MKHFQKVVVLLSCCDVNRALVLLKHTRNVAVLKQIVNNINLGADPKAACI